MVILWDVSLNKKDIKIRQKNYIFNKIHNLVNNSV